MVTPNYDQPYYDGQNPADITVDLEELRHIAIAGAGAAGVAQIGAIMALDKAGLLDKVEDYAGTSAGAILAAPCAFGYSGEDLKKIVLDQEFTKFLRAKKMSALPYNFSNYGVFSGLEIRDWVRKMAAKRLGDPDINFSELKDYKDHAQDTDNTFFLNKAREAKNRLELLRRYFKDETFCYQFVDAETDPNFENLEAAAAKLKEIAGTIRNLHVIGAKVVKEPGRHNPIGQYEEVVFNHANEDYDHVPIAQAVRASASFPFVFRLATIERKDGTIEKFSDGGMCNVIPLNVFDIDGKPNPHALAIRAEDLTPEHEKGKRHVPLPAPKRVTRWKERLVGPIHWMRQKLVERRLGQSIVEKDHFQPDWKDMSAGIFFGPKTARYAAELICDTLTDFLKRPENKGHLLLVDRGNVQTTDFIQSTTPVKEWMLNSGIIAAERVIEYQRQQKAATKETKEIGGGGPGLEEESASHDNKKWANQDFIKTTRTRIR